MTRFFSTRAKRVLLLVLLIGVLCFSGTGGTLSSFNAETTNAGSQILSGTLTMSNTVGSQSACLSAGGSVGTPSGNINANCNAVITLPTNVEPGEWNTSQQEASLTIANTGSLNGSGLTLFAPSATDCAETQTSAGTSLTFNKVPSVVTLGTSISVGTVTSIQLSSVPEPITAGDLLVVSNSSGQFLTATASTSATGSTTTQTISVNSVTAANSFSTSSTVDDVSAWPSWTPHSTFPTLTSGLTDGTPVTSLSLSSLPSFVKSGDLIAVTNSAGQEQTFTASGDYAALTASATTIGITSVAANYNFAAGSTVEDVSSAVNGSWRPFCSNTVLYVQETTNGGAPYYCWYGPGSSAAVTGGSEASTDGLCDTPLTVSAQPVTAGLTPTAVTFSELPVAINNNDTIQLTNSSGQSEAFTVSGNYSVSTSAVSVALSTSTGAATYSFAVGSSGIDSNTQGALSSGTYTLSNFDTSEAQNTAGLSLYPITSAGVVSKSTTALVSGAKRYFTVGVYLPNISTAQNVLQGLQSTFGLSWYLTQ